MSNKPLIVPYGPKSRLMLKRWDGHGGSPNDIQVQFQHMRPNGAWHSASNGLLLSPDTARILAPALLEMAATIEAAPTNPEPTEQSREDSRWP